jgi:SRSO17 transposase
VLGDIGHPQLVRPAAGELAVDQVGGDLVRLGIRRLARAAGGELPVRWLLVEWPTGKPEPTKYWLSDLPEVTPLVELVRLARLRWRVEQDYRELKGALGLDHFQGRGWAGWHHHVTLVSVAHGFLTLERLRRPKPAASA